jgi:hypothetical protein
LPGRIIATLQDRGRSRLGPTLCAGCCLWAFVVPESRRSARPGRTGVGWNERSGVAWKRIGSLSGAQRSREKPARARSVPGVAGADGAGRPPLAPVRTPSPTMTQGNPGCADALGHSPVRADRIRNDGDCLRGKASAEGICFAWRQYITIEPSRPRSRLVSLRRERRRTRLPSPSAPNGSSSQFWPA